MTKSLNETDDPLFELLLAWEESRAAGIPVSAAALCGDRTELAHDLEREIKRLESLDHFMFPALNDAVDSTHASLLVASQIDRFPNLPGYEILEEIGRGGMGVVYKARQHSLNRLVAIKTLAGRSWSQPGFVARLRQEAKALSLINDPHVVQVFDIVETSEAVSIVLEFVEGQNLARRLNGMPISPTSAAEFALTLARTLTTVHLQGLLHRDIKPANVLIDQAGGVKIADFGLVKEIGTASGLTATGDLFGSPSYMSPEQAEGRFADVDARTDVYAIGATLYEMLTGRPPFTGSSTVDTLNQVLHRDPIGPRFLNPGTPRDLETICLKCLEKDSNQRFQTAQELSEELSRFLQRIPIRSRPIGFLERCIRWCKRRPTAASLIGISVAVTIALVSIVGYGNASNQQNLETYNYHLKRLNDELRHAAARAQALQRIAEENERRAKDGLYVADINRAAVAWRQEDTREMVSLLNRHIPKPGEPDRRGFEWRFLNRQATLAKKQLLEFEFAVYSMCYSPDRRFLAAGGKGAVAKIFHPDAGRVWREFATGQIEINGIAFSPDQKELATAGDDGTIRIWDLESMRERLAIKTPYWKVFQLAYVPDGSRIVSCGVGPEIHIFDASSGLLINKLVGHTDTVESLALEDEGKTLVTASNDHTIRIWNLQEGTERKSINSVNHVEPIVFVPRRGLVITGMTDGLLSTIDIRSGQEIGSVKQIDRIGALALHPDGSLLATGDAGGTIRLRRIGTEGHFLDDDYQPWQAHRGSVHSLLWSNDGLQLISAGNDGRILSWNHVGQQRVEPKRLALEHAVGNEPIVPRSLLEEIRLSKGTLIAWDLWAKTRFFMDKGSSYSHVSVSPDGRFLAAIDSPQTVKLFSVPNDAIRPIDEHALATWHSPFALNSTEFSGDSHAILVHGWAEAAALERREVEVAKLRVPSFEPAESIPFRNTNCAEISTDGCQIYFATSTDLIRWDIVNQRIVWKTPQSNVRHVVLSPDGSFVAAAISDRTVVVRKTVDGEPQFQLTNHRSVVSQLIFTEDNRTLVSAGKDGTIKFTHVATGQELLEFPQIAEVQGFEFSMGCRNLVCQIVRESDDLPHEILIFNATDPSEENKVRSVTRLEQ